MHPVSLALISNASLKPEQANASTNSICSAHSRGVWKELGLCLCGMNFPMAPIAALILGEAAVSLPRLGSWEKMRKSGHPPPNPSTFRKQVMT